MLVDPGVGGCELGEAKDWWIQGLVDPRVGEPKGWWIQTW